MLTFYRDEHHIVADFYSKISFVCHLTMRQSITVKIVSMLKEMFAEQWILRTFKLDNGPQIPVHLHFLPESGSSNM